MAALQTFSVGDVVTVAKPCMGNPAGARAVVIEIYDNGHGQDCPSLLFANSAHDGFSRTDLWLFGVKLEGHEPTLTGYVFTSAVRLYEDWRAGRFAPVWRDAVAEAGL